MPDTVTIAVRLGLYLDLMVLFGLPLFGLYALRGAERETGSVLPFKSLLVPCVIIGIVLSAIAMLVLADSMSGVRLGEVDRSTLAMLITGTSIGTAWQIRLATLLVSGLCAVSLWRQPTLVLWLLSIFGAIALATLAWTGHGSADGGLAGWVHLGADIIHLWAAGVWLGALLALMLLLYAPAMQQTPTRVFLLHRALQGFGAIGSAVVAALMASGLANSWALVGPANLGTLFTTLYGQLLIAKLALFGLMLVLAGTNRLYHTPVLALALATSDIGVALRALRRSLALESACGLTVLGLVAWLGLLAPPASGL